MKKLNKAFTILIIICLLNTTGLLKVSNGAEASSTNEEIILTKEEQKNLEEDLNSELQLALATEINENLNVEVTDVSKLGTIVIDSIYKDDNNSTNINMKLSPQTEEIIVEVESEEGESIAKDSYRVEIIDIRSCLKTPSH